MVDAETAAQIRVTKNRRAWRNWRSSRELPISDRVSLVYRLRRPRSVALVKGAIVRREVFAWIQNGDDKIGFVNAASYHVRDCEDSLDFFTIMDLEHQEEYELGAALTCGWPDVMSEVAPYGPILFIKLVRLADRYRTPALLRSLVKVLIADVFPNGSIVVFQAAEGNSEGARSHEGVMGSACLSIDAIPGSPGDDGWMWARYPGAEKVPSPVPGDYEVMEKQWLENFWI